MSVREERDIISHTEHKKSSSLEKRKLLLLALHSATPLNYVCFDIGHSATFHSGAWLRLFGRLRSITLHAQCQNKRNSRPPLHSTPTTRTSVSQDLRNILFILLYQPNHNGHDIALMENPKKRKEGCVTLSNTSK